MKIAFLLYPTTKVKVDEDSSFWVMLELKKRGHDVSYFESKELMWSQGGPRAFLTPARLDARKGYRPSLPDKFATDLSTLDCIFIRKEPPFNTGYLYALQLLETIKGRVFILNDPAGIAMCNEKLFSLEFPAYLPETIVTESVPSARAFILKLKRPVIVKPLNNKGGVGIFATSPKDTNLPSLLEIATRSGSKKIMIQRLIPTDRFGDKRILILNGQPLGAFLRRPPSHDLRANLSTGGTMHEAALTAYDKKLVGTLAPKLLAHGLYFVGIDVIGRYLTEINVTSPAGIPEINQFNKVRLEARVVSFMEERMKG